MSNSNFDNRVQRVTNMLDWNGLTYTRWMKPQPGQFCRFNVFTVNDSEFRINVGLPQLNRPALTFGTEDSMMAGDMKELEAFIGGLADQDKTESNVIPIR